MDADKIKPHLAAARARARLHDAGIPESLQFVANLSANETVACLGEWFAYPVIADDESRALSPAFDIIPYQDLLRLNCFVCRRPNGALTAVIGDPFDDAVLTFLRLRIRQPFGIALATAETLKTVLNRHEDALELFAAIDAPAGVHLQEDNITLKTISEDSSPIIRAVNSILYQAYREGASDIHLESRADGLLLRYRLDGILVEINRIEGADTTQKIISRIKVMSELDIAEKRVPQDGRLKVGIQGNTVDFRVSIMPSIHGEDAVLRLLDKKNFTSQLESPNLSQLGFDKASVGQIRALARKPYGMLLMTGPTGSGKTTTLYAAISEIADGRDKIITIEDPVEYQLEGVLQIPVNEKKGLTFARGLRSILRHDPDRILVGEIRDRDTAEIAVQSALTGHLVFSTVHANNPFDVIGRLTYMGIDLFNFISALNGVVAQRLVRLVCEQCKSPAKADAQLCDAYNIKAETFQFYAGDGCARCRQTGYYGRHAVGEILMLDDDIREMIIRRLPVHKVRQHAVDNGMTSIRRAITEMVRRGETTLEELARNTL